MAGSRLTNTRALTILLIKKEESIMQKALIRRLKFKNDIMKFNEKTMNTVEEYLTNTLMQPSKTKLCAFTGDSRYIYKESLAGRSLTWTQNLIKSLLPSEETKVDWMAIGDLMGGKYDDCKFARVFFKIGEKTHCTICAIRNSETENEEYIPLILTNAYDHETCKENVNNPSIRYVMLMDRAYMELVLSIVADYETHKTAMNMVAEWLQKTEVPEEMKLLIGNLDEEKILDFMEYIAAWVYLNCGSINKGGNINE